MDDNRIDDIDYWLQRLEAFPTGPREWVAKCPAHDDRTPSLSICETSDGGVLVHCFAGCEFHEILEAIENSPTLPVKITMTKSSPASSSKLTGMGLWMDLFEFPPSELDPFFVGGFERHLRILPDRIDFLWPQLPAARRYRLSAPSNDAKGYLWEKSGPKPPLWPQLEDQLDEEIFITEGESDCIVLRRMGLPAYAITTGGSRSHTPRFPAGVFRDLIDRGVKTIYLAFDDDDVGHSTASTVYNQIIEFEKRLPPELAIDVRILPVSEMTLPFLGEKDLRQVWLRVRDVETFAEEFAHLKQGVDVDDPKTRLYDHNEFLAKPAMDLTWIVADVVQTSGIGWISGYPKMGKSWIALDLAFSIATGSPFLGRFEVLLPGDVVYVVKENSDSSTAGRIRKILEAKKPEISVSIGEEELLLEGGNRVMIDASRDFRFEPGPVETLIQKVLRHRRKTGREVRLIVIDPLSFSLPPGKFDINTFTDFQTQIVDLIAHITRRTGSAVMVVHHQGKGETSTMLGSVAAEASFDNKIAFITKGRSLEDYVPGDPVRIHIAHRDGRSVIFDLQLQITDSSYKASVVDVEDSEIHSVGPKLKISYVDRQKSVSEKVLSVVPREAEFTWKDMVDEFRKNYTRDEISDSLLANSFDWMRNPGNQPPLIESHRRGFYRRFQPRQ